MKLLINQNDFQIHFSFVAITFQAVRHILRNDSRIFPQINFVWEYLLDI